MDMTQTYDVGDNRTIEATLTSEGVIIDTYLNGKHTGGTIAMTAEEWWDYLNERTTT